MKMKLGKISLLIALIILSIVQTARLWFDDFSSRNFFYSAIDKIDNKPKGDLSITDKSLLNPHTLAIYNKEGYFIVIKEDKEYEELIFNSRKIMKDVLSKGKIEGNVKQIKWDDLWKKRAVFMEISYELEWKDLVEDLNITKPIDKNEYKFDYIVLIPSADISGSIECYLINIKQSQSMKIVMDKKQSQNNNEAVNNIDKLLESKLPIYISSKEGKIGKFSRNVFLPYIDINNNYIFDIELKKAFFNEKDELVEAEFKKYAGIFFENSQSIFLINIKKDNKTWPGYYNGEGISVTYINGVFEYENKTVSNEKNTIGLKEAYTKAVLFMQKDNIGYEYYLDKIIETSNGYEFGFNYRFNNYDFFFSQNQKKLLDIEYPIEIYVKNDRIYKYKRIMLDYKSNILYEDQNNIKDYLTVLNEFYEQNKNHKFPIENMYIAYYIDDVDGNIKLKWIINSSKTFTIDF